MLQIGYMAVSLCFCEGVFSRVTRDYSPILSLKFRAFCAVAGRSFGHIIILIVVFISASGCYGFMSSIFCKRLTMVFGPSKTLEETRS